MKLIYLRESIFFRLFSSNDADTRSTRHAYNFDDGGGRRVVIYAARLAIHPPTTANGINPSCPISPERFYLPLFRHPPFRSLVFVFCSPTAALCSRSPASLFSFLRFLPSRTPIPAQVLLQALALIFPLPAIRFYRSTVMVVSAKSTGASITSTRLSQPPPTTTTTSQRCIAVGGSPCAYITAGNLWML